MTVQRTALLALPWLLVLGTPSPARVIFMPPIPFRVLSADCVVVGKVKVLEGKRVVALPHAGAKEKIEYQLAVIQVEEPILGVRGRKQIEVAFQRKGSGKNEYTPPLADGAEGCLFLMKHFEQPFYVPSGHDSLFKRVPAAEHDTKQMELARRCGKLLEDPDAGLKSKDPDDRLLTAAMLILRYRIRHGFFYVREGREETEPIDAGQSKLLLTAVAEGDWTRFLFEMGGNLRPPNLLNALGVTAKDGWKPPSTPGYERLEAAAIKWFKENAATYRIRRYVPEKAPE